MISEIKKDLIGNWHLVSMTAIGEDASVIYPNGKNVLGFLQYLENDMMAVQLGNSMRANFQSNDHREGTIDEIAEAYNGYIAYFGKYLIVQKGGYIIHDVQQSLYPNWIGKKNKRYFEIDNGILTLTSVPLDYDGTIRKPTLTWRKL